MFGFGHKSNSKLKVFERDGKFGVGESAELVPCYTMESKAEAEQYIKEHGAEVEEENG